MQKGVYTISYTKLSQVSLVLSWYVSSLILIWLKLWQIKTRLDLGPACLGLGLKRLDLIGALLVIPLWYVVDFVLGFFVSSSDLIPNQLYLLSHSTLSSVL